MLAKAIVPQETKKRWQYIFHDHFILSGSQIVYNIFSLDTVAHVILLLSHFLPEQQIFYSINAHSLSLSPSQVYFPSWDASATLAPPLPKLSPRQPRKMGGPRGRGKQVPTHQPSPRSDRYRSQVWQPAGQHQCSVLTGCLSLLITIATIDGSVQLFLWDISECKPTPLFYYSKFYRADTLMN